MPDYKLTLIERFLSKVEMVTESGCWIWMGKMDAYGYGRIEIKPFGQSWKEKFSRAAHRVAYEIFVGPLPEDLDLDHLCRVRCCVNPHHLEAVTRRENLMRGNAVGAGTLIGNRVRAEKQRAMTHCGNGHEYTPDNTRYYRGKRRCQICNRLNSLNSHNRRKLRSSSIGANS